MSKSFITKAPTPKQALLGLILAQLTCWTLFPYFVNGNLPLDVIREGLSWGTEWQLGYHKHPPLTSWIANTSYELFGDFGPYLISQLFICLSYIFSYLLGKQLIGARAAAAATLLLATVFYYQWPTPEFNHNIAQIPFWAAAIYFFHQAMQKSEAVWWYCLGAVLALGALTKYTIALLVPLMFFFMLFGKQQRAKFLSPHPYLAAMLGLIILAPHLYWLTENDFLPFKYYDARSALEQSPSVLMRLLNPIKFILAQIADHLPLLVILLVSGLTTLAHLFQRGRSRKAVESASKRSSEADPLNETYEQGETTKFILIFLFGPLSLAALWSLYTGDKLRTMWGAPMWSLSGVAVIYFLIGPVSREQMAKLYKTVLPFIIALALIYGLTALVHPLFSKKPRRTTWPAVEMSRYFANLWQDKQSCPLTIIAGENWLTGLIAHKMLRRPSVLINGDLKISPWITEDEIKKHGMLVVWQQGRAEPMLSMPDQLKPSLLKTRGQKKFEWPKHKKAPPLIINWAILQAPNCSKKQQL
ncbi:MAG: hypothetical protein DHS20C08_00310 [Rhodomicrobium sp.]|nr:MAG: hypothetical protein DHS20C08_00310 [Rhodomicrobium sp.]